MVYSTSFSLNIQNQIAQYLNRLEYSYYYVNTYAYLIHLYVIVLICLVVL